MRKNLYVVLYDFNTKRLTYCLQTYLPHSLGDKYRYKVLKGYIQVDCREFLIEVCDSEEVAVLKSVIGWGHVYMHIEYALKQEVGTIVELLKGRSSPKIRMEFSKLKGRYRGRYFWASGYGIWSSGNNTDKMVNDYLETHRQANDPDKGNFYLSKCQEKPRSRRIHYGAKQLTNLKTIFTLNLF